MLPIVVDHQMKSSYLLYREPSKKIYSWIQFHNINSHHDVVEGVHWIFYIIPFSWTWGLKTEFPLIKNVGYHSTNLKSKCSEQQLLTSITSNRHGKCPPTFSQSQPNSFSWHSIYLGMSKTISILLGFISKS